MEYGGGEILWCPWICWSIPWLYCVVYLDRRHLAHHGRFICLFTRAASALVQSLFSGQCVQDGRLNHLSIGSSLTVNSTKDRARNLNPSPSPFSCTTMVKLKYIYLCIFVTFLVHSPGRAHRKSVDDGGRNTISIPKTRIETI